MKWIWGGLALAILAAVPLGFSAGAQEGELKGLLDDQQTMVLRVHNVADLTVRLTNFIRSNLIVTPAGSEISEDAPIFGRAEEGEIFFAGTDELMDMIVSNVRPEVWGTGGPTIRTVGSHALVVTAPSGVQDEVNEYLTDLRESVGRLVTLELRVIRFTGAGPGPALRDRSEGLALLEAAEAGQGAEVVLSTRITAFNGQMVSLYRARQKSFVQDYDVEVAQKARIADPIVGVQQIGLSFDARCVTRGESHVLVDLRAYLTSVAGEDRTIDAVGGPITAPQQRLVDFQSTVSVPVGGYAVVGSSFRGTDGRWALLVSPTVDRITNPGGGK